MWVGVQVCEGVWAWLSVREWCVREWCVGGCMCNKMACEVYIYID